MSFVPRETSRKITDWFLSKEAFVLEYHKDLDSYQTIGVPDDLSFYYKSDRYLSHQKNKSLVSQVYQALKSRRNQWKKKLVLKSLSNKPKAVLKYRSDSATSSDTRRQDRHDCCRFLRLIVFYRTEIITDG